MEKIFRLVSAGILSIVLMISSVMPVCASEKNISAYASGPTLDSATVSLDPECHLYGSASCVEGNMYGNPCYWTAKQYGDLALAATRTAASFGSGSSYTDIMSKSYMVTCGGSLLNTYEKSAKTFTFYTQANTKLYY